LWGIVDMPWSKEYEKEYMKAYRETHREERKKYRDEHRDEINANKKKYVAAHREKINEQARKLRKKDPQRYREYKNQRPMDEAKDCSSYLGVHVAERALSKFFKEVTRMPYGNPGYDFVCNKGYKIDVKSACLKIGKPNAPNKRWIFSINQNQIPDYFLCIGFDDRDNLTPMHIWLFPGEAINNKHSLSITNSPSRLQQFTQYEHPLDKVEECCTAMRSGVPV
jgi:hypothetical protein